ncbi:MAG: V-type ATP synthase subunit I [Promethearchaeota archaeon]
MLSVAPMKIVKIIAPRKHTREITQLIHENGKIELIDIEKKGSSLENELERETLSLLQQVKSQNTFFQITRPSLLPDRDRIPIKDQELKDVIQEAKKTIDKVAPAIENFRTRQAELQEQKTSFEGHKKIVEKLILMDVSVELFGKGSHFFFQIGEVKSDRISRLKFDLDQATDKKVFTVTTSANGNTILLVGGRNEFLKTIERILIAFGFLEYSTPPGLTGKPSEIRKSLDRKLKKVTTELETIESEIQEFRANFERDLQFVEEILEIETHRLNAESKYSYKGYIVEVTGWIKAKESETFSHLIHEKIPTATVEILNPDDVELPFTEVPSCLENPAYVRSYEPLVHSFGTPSLREFDPSKIMAITFPILFGIMFADVGHGLILLLLGFLGLFFKDIGRDPQTMKEELQDYLRKGGPILIICGLSSILFGFLFGSYFGIHDGKIVTEDGHSENYLEYFKLFGVEYDISELWFVPTPEKPDFNAETTGLFLLLEICLVIAFLQLSFGLILNLFSHIRKGKTKDGFFLPFLLVLFYSGGFILTFTYSLNFMEWFDFNTSKDFDIALLPGFAFPVPPSGYIALGLVVIPVILSIGYHLIFHGLDGASEILDYLVSLIGNTVSYTRIFALNLVHGILSQIFFLLPAFVVIATYKAHGETTQVGLLALIIQCVVVVGLETLIVFLQTLRLHWVEWFSKLGYHGSGTQFTPFRSRRLISRSLASENPSSS